MIMSPPNWFLSRAFFSLDLARLILKEKRKEKKSMQQLIGIKFKPNGLI